MIEGNARSYVPERPEASAVPGRKKGSFAFLKGLFSRRSAARRSAEVDPVAVGELTRYAGMPPRRPRIECSGPVTSSASTPASTTIRASGPWRRPHPARSSRSCVR